MTGPFSEEEAAWLATTYVARPDAQLGDAADAHWLIYCGVLVFSMQSGFAMLCAGSVRAKNAQNILLKNLVDVCVGACFFWATGYGLAFGSRADGARANGFAGNDGFVLANGFAGKNGYDSWFFQFAFAATASTIVSGAVAERRASAKERKDPFNMRTGLGRERKKRIERERERELGRSRPSSNRAASTETTGRGTRRDASSGAT